MLFLRTITSTVAVLIAANFELCFCGCARAEYEINGECCPMCAPGNRVYWHCTVDTSTTCVPCLASTFTDEPNGFTKCFPCTVCATVKGLKIHKSCIRSGDTLCEPQEGFHCIKQNKGSCELAVEHSKCQPGQYIEHTGTAISDTVCVDCTVGSYSNGSVMSCLPHLKCEMMGLKEKKAGTTSSDAECEKVTSVGFIVLVTIAVLVVAVIVAALFYIKYRKRKPQRSNKNVEYRSQQPSEDDDVHHRHFL
ncbi:tumor necrosis factor receptor superfamily member 14 isoform X2 [Danio aesculapii]|uniref:tumor necrosis factor receptor superfamily member 14 isoform X2 n=1 Tax=Danio aesculapii TaxID=1142201 RepID=UPI0024BF761D|nr:tumor necrosis factor receptor superfamily member 14 isoform X2 [Danio aesculapii]